MIAKRIVTLALAIALYPAAASAAQKAIIFPFDLIDQQQQFEIGLMPTGLDPEDKRRLEIITAELTKLVPNSVPSLFHNPAPDGDWRTPKNTVSSDAAKPNGSELAGPGMRSATRSVPASVPSLFHNSTPDVPSLAVK